MIRKQLILHGVLAALAAVSFTGEAGSQTAKPRPAAPKATPATVDWVRLCDEAAGSPWDLDAPGYLRAKQSSALRTTWALTSAQAYQLEDTSVDGLDSEEALRVCTTALQTSDGNAFDNRRMLVNMARAYYAQRNMQSFFDFANRAAHGGSAQAIYMISMLNINQRNSIAGIEAKLMENANVGHLPSIDLLGDIYDYEWFRSVRLPNGKVNDAILVNKNFHRKALKFYTFNAQFGYPNSYQKISDAEKKLAGIDESIAFRREMRELDRQNRAQQQADFEQSFGISNEQIAAGVRAHNARVDAANAASVERARAQEAQQQRAMDAYNAANRPSGTYKPRTGCVRTTEADCGIDGLGGIEPRP